MQKLSSLAALLVLSLLAGCATVPTGPSLLAMPGTGKTYDEFRASDSQCRQIAARRVGGASNDPAIRHAVVGTAVGTVAGAAIGGQQGAAVGAGVGLLAGSVSGADSSRSYGYEAQRRYDETYIQCMYGSGHKVPVSASVARSLTETRSPTQPTASASYPPPPPNTPPPSSPPPDYVPPSVPSR